MNKPLLHKHLIINATINNAPTEKDLPFMVEWFKEVIEDINMNILMGPFVTYSNMIGNRGFTGVTIIETSHAALHTWDECSPAIMKLDIYTCSELEINIIFDKIKVFSPVDIDYLYIDRDKGISVIKNGEYRNENR